MRKAERLVKFYDEVKGLHQEKLPDWRFGQLMTNFFGWLYAQKKIDAFFPEDEDMLGYLREFFEDMK